MQNMMLDSSMRRVFSLLIVILFLPTVDLYSQSNIIPLKEFSVQFKADSNGCLKFRNKHVKMDRKKNILLINNMNLKEYSEKKILEILGQPNVIEESKTQQQEKKFKYYTSDHKKCQDEKYTLGIVIVFKNQKVAKVDLQEIDQLHIQKKSEN